MKVMSFDEFLAMPPGTIFGQVTGLPHQFSTGMWRLVELMPDEDEYEYGPAVRVQELTCYEDGSFVDIEHIYRTEVEADHRFLVYESDDLDRLAGLIGRGPGWVAQGGEPATTTPADPADPHPGWSTCVWMDTNTDIWNWSCHRTCRTLHGGPNRRHGGVAGTEAEARAAMAAEITWMDGNEGRD